MQLAINEELVGHEIKSRPIETINLSERDYEIIDFLLDMKFASTEDLFERFFKTTRDNHEAKNDVWTRKRICQLEKSKFLRSVKSFSESTRYIIATFKGYYALSNKFPDRQLTKPSAGIDQRTFNHDKLLLKIRSQLESQLKHKSWLSDRKLKSFPALCGGLTGTYVPDGIYESSTGEKVALELEISLKAKSRYREKVQKYLSLFRSNSSDKPFSKVHFICAKDAVINHLERETGIYQQYFKIEKLTNFLPTIK